MFMNGTVAELDQNTVMFLKYLKGLRLKQTVISKTYLSLNEVLKVALSQKILENFYVSNINIRNHYPEQKI